MKKIYSLLFISVLLTGCMKQPNFRWANHKISGNAYNFKSAKFENTNISFNYSELETAKKNVKQVIENKGTTFQISNAVSKFNRLHQDLYKKSLFIMTLYYGNPSFYELTYNRANTALDEDVIFYNSLFEEAAKSSDDIKKYFFNTLNDEEIAQQLEERNADSDITRINSELQKIADDFSYYYATTSSYKSDEAFEHGVEVYVDYVAKANELAKLKGFENYLDYSYKVDYARDYSPSEGHQFAVNLKNSFVGKNYSEKDSFLPEDDGSKDYRKLKTLIDYNFNNLQNDGAELFDNYADFMGGKFINSYNNLWRDGYYYFSSAEDSLGTAYVLFDESLDSEIAFFSKENQDVLSVIHEFGHFFALDSNESNYEQSYDILETHSQANEYVFCNYVKNNYENKYAKAFGDSRFHSDIGYLIDFAFIIEVENYAYHEADLTTEKLADYIHGLTDEYEELGIPETKNYWMYPCIVSSGYYISYATSLLEAMQFYVMDLNDAKNCYFNFSLDNSDKTMVEKWTSVGLKSPFSTEASDFVLSYLDTL